MSSEPLSPDNVGALRVVDLKEELKTRGLATDGKKVNAISSALRLSRSHVPSRVVACFLRNNFFNFFSPGGGAEGIWELEKTGGGEKEETDIETNIFELR